MPILLVLAISCLSSSIIVRVIDPAVPDIARDLAVAPATVALLSTAYSLPYALSQPVLGPLGDALGKVRIIRWCLGVMVAAMAVSVVAPSIEVLFGARLVAGLAAGGIIPLAIASVGDNIALAGRQVALSRLLMAMLFGQLIGAIGSGILTSLAGWRWMLAATFALVTLTFTLSLLYRAPRTGQPRRFSLTGLREGYARVFANRRAKFCYTAVFVEGICVFGVLPYLAVLLEAHGSGGIREAGFVLAGMGIGGLLYTLLVRQLLEALGGQLNLMRAGGFIAGAGLASYPWAGTWPLEMGSFVLIGLGFYMLHNSLQTQATELAPDYRGAAVALHAFFLFLGQACGPVLYGFGLFNAGAVPTLAATGLAMALLGLWVSASLRVRE